SETSRSRLASARPVARLVAIEVAADLVARGQRGQSGLLAHAASTDRVGDAVAAGIEPAAAGDIHRIHHLTPDDGKATVDGVRSAVLLGARQRGQERRGVGVLGLDARRQDVARRTMDRKSTRLNSSHGSISYAVFCLKKKKN